MSRLGLVALMAAAPALSACAQAVLSQDADVTQAGVAQVAKSEVTQAAKSEAPVRAAKHSPSRHSSYGLVSYYSYGGQTASGEQFDPGKLTAAHRTLPFGTRLQVTNLASGRSVVVRINDRGPFIKGRVVDVSYEAAKELDLLDTGVAKVKVEVLPRPQ
jgi:rare lipoprotein A